ncbi:hypothetical protein ABG067_003841 [Albugo candida]
MHCWQSKFMTREMRFGAVKSPMKIVYHRFSNTSFRYMSAISYQTTQQLLGVLLDIFQAAYNHANKLGAISSPYDFDQKIQYDRGSHIPQKVSNSIFECKVIYFDRKFVGDVCAVQTST